MKTRISRHKLVSLSLAIAIGVSVSVWGILRSNGYKSLQSGAQELGASREVSRAELSAIEREESGQKSELETMLEEHFSKDYSSAEVYLATLLEVENYDRLIGIKQELTRRIDNNLDLQEFEKFGLVSITERGFEINHRTHPGWLTLSEIFSELRSSVGFRNREIYPLLRSQGVSQSSISRIETFLINSDPQESLYKSMLSVLDDVLVRARELPEALQVYESYLALSNEMSERMNSEYEEIMKEWVFNLIDSLDEPDRQRIFSFFLDRHTITRIFSSSIQDVVDRFIHDVNTDEARIAIRQELAN